MSVVRNMELVSSGADSLDVAPRARPGDLVLMYRAGTASEAKKWNADPGLLQSIANIFIVKVRPVRDKRWGYQAEVAQVALLENPLRLEQMKVDRVLRGAPFVRMKMRGRRDVTPSWYRLHGMIEPLWYAAPTRRH